MKKSIILLLAMVCTITACQVEEMRDVDECSSHHFCIETSFPSIEADNVETKSSIQPRITLKWSDGDLISVVNLTTGKNLSGDLVARVDGDQVYFEGDLGGSVRSGDKLVAIYPSQNYTGISNITDISFDLSTQTCSSMNEVPFFAYSLFTCKTVGVVNVESPFIIPVSFNQIAISNIEPNTKIDYIELSNVGNNISFNVNKAAGMLDVTSTSGKVRITPEAKQSGADGSLFAYCALAESSVADRTITVKALPNIYTAQWAQSAMSTSKYYTSIASDFTTTEYKDFMVSEPSSLDVGAEGGKLIFNVSSEKKDWTVSSVPDLDITPSSGSGCENLQVVVNIPKNEGYSEKTYLITFEAADLEYTYSIKQDVLASNKRVEFPDMNLKKYLLNNYDLDEDGGISEEEAANITMVSCPNKQIADLTGLDKCKNITTINCSGNYISEIRLPGLTQLVRLSCYDNPIEVLDLSNCSALKVLNIQNNTDNAIVGDQLKLTYYDQAESLTIDVTNTIINRMYICRSDKLAYLDVSKNTHLTKLSANVNPNLKSIDVSKLVKLEFLDFGDCGLTDLDVSQNVVLAELYVTNNKLSTLNVSQNKLLQVLKCKGNQLSNLKLLNNDKLETLDVSDNQLSAINVRNNTALLFLNVSNNTELEMVDVKANTALQLLYAEGLAISGLDLSANNALTDVRISNNPNLTTLTCNDAFDFTTTHIRINKGLDIISASGSDLTPSIGDLITVNLSTGVVFSTSSNGSFKIVSVDETMLAWSTEDKATNAVNYNDGMANMNTIKAVNPDLSKYPAFEWCSAHGTDWYLPAYGELSELKENQGAIDSTLYANGYTRVYKPHSNYYYLSSTENNSFRACAHNFGMSSAKYPPKDETACYVRAVLAF